MTAKAYIVTLGSTTQTTDRKIFVTLTRESFFSADNEEARAFNAATTKRITKTLADQQDAAYLKEQGMPKVCAGMEYTPPVHATHHRGPRHDNMLVVTNNAHVKQTNNGYKRSDGGAFYCHWSVPHTLQ